MKELNGQKTELLINYLNKQIDRNRRTAEEMRESGNMAYMALSYESSAHELDCALAYLMGLMHAEERP